MSKNLNPMAVRSALSYDTEELARALNVTSATIRNMVRRGMPVMASQKPYLFSGAEVREFIQNERKRNKCPMPLDALYCPSCRKGQKPAGRVVELCVLNMKTQQIRGLCDACGCQTFRIISKAALPDFAAIYRITTADHTQT